MSDQATTPTSTPLSTPPWPRSTRTGSASRRSSVVMTDDRRPIPAWQQLSRPSATIDASRARELAFELLMPAEVAEQWEQAR